MDTKSQKPRVKYHRLQRRILEKVAMKSRLIMKSAITQKSPMMVGRYGYEDSIVAAGYSDGCVRIYNLNTDHKISQMETNVGKKQVTPVNCIRWRPSSESGASLNSVLLVGNTNGTLVQYIARTGKELHRSVEEGNFILAMDYSFNGKTFATAGKDNLIRVYDEQTKTISTELKGVKWHTHGHNNRIFSVKFMPNDPNVLVSGGWDQNVNIWDIRQGTSVVTIFGPKIAGDAIDVRDDLILTGSNRGNDQLELWDWKMNKVVQKFRWDLQKQLSNAFLFCAQFSHNAKDMVVACGGTQMKMFSLNGGEEVLEVKIEDNSGSLYTCDSGYNTNKYLVGGSTGTMFHMTGTKPYE